MSTTSADITELVRVIENLNRITGELAQKIATLETEVAGLKDILKNDTLTATKGEETATQPGSDIEVNVISCKKSSTGDVIVKGSITNNGDTTRAIEYIAYITDSDGNMITFEDGDVDDLEPGMTEYVTEWVEYSDKWDKCGLKITSIK